MSDTDEQLTVNVRFDGKDCPVDGSPFAGAAACRTVDSRTLDILGVRANHAAPHQRDLAAAAADVSHRVAGAEPQVSRAFAEPQPVQTLGLRILHWLALPRRRGASAEARQQHNDRTIRAFRQRRPAFRPLGAANRAWQILLFCYHQFGAYSFRRLAGLQNY